MKQRWLIKPHLANEPTRTLELDSPTRDELIILMATAIESVYLQHLNLKTKEALTDERITAASQDHCGTPQPQSNCLPQAIVAEASRPESGK